MKWYKKPETRLKHDKLREEHLQLIDRKLKEYAENPNEKLGKYIQCLYEQLDYYDREVLNVKPNVNF